MPNREEEQVFPVFGFQGLDGGSDCEPKQGEGIGAVDEALVDGIREIPIPSPKKARHGSDGDRDDEIETGEEEQRFPSFRVPFV